MTRFYWKCHSACAIYTGGFIAFVLITGAFAVFANPIYKWETRHITEGSSATFNPAILSRGLEAARLELESHGGTAFLLSVDLPDENGGALRASYFNRDHPQAPFRFNQPWFFNSVFIDSVDGSVLGVYEDDKSFSNFIRTVHVRLFAGVWGRNFVGLFGLALLFLSLSGLLILGRFLGNRAVWLIRRTSFRAGTADLHKLVGFLGLLPLLLFAVTGFWLGMQGRLMDWFSMERPDHFEREPVISPEADAALPIDFKAVLERTEEVFPELIPQQLSWSMNGERTLRIRGRVLDTIQERLSQGMVLDKADLSVLKKIDTQSSDWQEKLFYLQEALHFGDFGGIPLMVVYFVVGMLLFTLPLSGYIVTRLRKRQSLMPVVGWSVFTIGYFVLSLILLRTQGIVVVTGYGTVALWVFVVGLVFYWLLKAWLQGKQTRLS